MEENPWDELCRTFLQLRLARDGNNDRQRLLSLAASTLPPENALRWHWAAEALADDERKWFVVALLSRAKRVPAVLLRPMLKAAFVEDASLNRHFIQPCVGAFGRRVVLEALLELFEQGSDTDKEAVTRAVYWLQPPRAKGWKHSWGRPDGAPIDDVKARMEALFEQYARNRALDQQRRLGESLARERRELELRSQGEPAGEARPADAAGAVR